MRYSVATCAQLAGKGKNGAKRLQRPRQHKPEDGDNCSQVKEEICLRQPIRPAQQIYQQVGQDQQNPQERQQPFPVR